MSKIDALAAAALITCASILWQGAAQDDSFSPYVSETGTIVLPSDYRQWQFVGTWQVTPTDGQDPGIHNVFVTPGTVEAYVNTGRYPDGAVFVKELYATEGSHLTTGMARWATDVQGWFVMVKDEKGRFPENPLWGDGWGWAFFEPADRMQTVTKDYKADCLACHLPAQKTDWIYLRGYPELGGDGSD